METIKKITVNKKLLEITLSGNQSIKIHLWGKTFYTVVSDNIPKSAIREIAQEFLREKEEIKVEKYLNTQIKTLKD